VLRMMREDNLLCVRRRAFVIPTTDSRHHLPVYPNLARDFTPMAIHQLWVADITYIRLRTKFVYLAVVLDAFSRRVIGWALGRTLGAELALAALRMALRERRPSPGWMHHSDRGVQYASGEYVATLLPHQARISMSRKGNPYDNAACESFMKTLKYEEVYRNEYRDLQEARASIGQFLEQIYNEKRLHSALGYVPPAEFVCHRRSSSSRETVHDPITARPAALGALPPNPRDLPPSGQNVSSFRRRPQPPPRHSGCRVGARVASPHSPILRPGTPRVDDRNLAVQ